MLILIDSTVVSGLTEGREDLERGVSCILDSVVRGEHIVLGPRDVFENIAKSDRLGHWERRTAASIAQNLTQLASLEHIFDSSVTIIHDHGPLVEKIGSRWKVQLAEVARRGLSRSVILGEDLSDVEIACFAARHYLIDQNLLGVLDLSVECQMAGGKGNTCRAFQQILTASTKWCLCITDSDRLTPLCQPSRLSRTHAALSAQHSAVVVNQYFDLPVREMENIIPKNIVTEALQEHCISGKEKWDRMIIDRRTSDDCVRHADLKFGTQFWTIHRKFAPNSAQIRFWEAEVARLAALGVIAMETDCPSARPCPRSVNKHAQCLCNITEPISENFLDHVATYMKGRSHHFSFRLTRTSDNREDWLELGRVVAEWCGAVKPGFFT
jgi:hypothetical protein